MNFYKTILKNQCIAQTFCPVTKKILDYRKSILVRNSDTGELRAFSNEGFKQKLSTFSPDQQEKIKKTMVVTEENL